MVLTQLIANLPFFLIYLVAGILAVARWDKHPTTSVWVVTGAAVSLFARVASLVMPMVFRSSGTDSISMIQLGHTATSLIANVGLACLVAAVFADRSKKSDPPQPFR